MRCIEIAGRPTKDTFSREFLRSWIHASLTVLGYHGKTPLNHTPYSRWLDDHVARGKKHRQEGVLRNHGHPEGSFVCALLNEDQWMEWHDGGSVGMSYRNYSVIHIRKDYYKFDTERPLFNQRHLEWIAKTILHECIHQCTEFPSGTDERCVSTLTAKLKPTVGVIAQTLLDATYKNAAFFAHTKLSYTSEAQGLTEDGYNQEQWRVRVGCSDKYGIQAKTIQQLTDEYRSN